MEDNNIMNTEEVTIATGNEGNTTSLVGGVLIGMIGAAAIGGAVKLTKKIVEKHKAKKASKIHKVDGEVIDAESEVVEDEDIEE